MANNGHNVVLSTFLTAFSIKKNLTQLIVRSRHNIAFIDGIRALSIIIVVLGHLVFFLQLFFPDPNFFEESLPIFLRCLTHGANLGVDMFFVISGYLIGRILLSEYKNKKAINFRHFYFRRFLRLMPVYWFGLLVGIALSFPNIKFIWTNLIYINNFIKPNNQFMGWTWSLAVEEQFYFILPVVLSIFLSIKDFRDNPIKYFSTLFVLMTLVSIYVIYHYGLSIPYYNIFSEEFNKISYYYYIKPYVCFTPLMSGVLVAYLELYYSKTEAVVIFLRNFKLFDPIALFSFLYILSLFFIAKKSLRFSITPEKFYLSVVLLVLSFSIAYLIFFMIYSRTKFSCIMTAFLSCRIFYVISQVSYSSYVFHPLMILPIYKILTVHFPSISRMELLICGGIISIACILMLSTFTYLLIEKPFMNLRNP